TATIAVGNYTLTGAGLPRHGPFVAGEKELSMSKPQKNDGKASAGMDRRRRGAAQRSGRKSQPLRPIKLTGKKIDVRRRDEGPAGWFVPVAESTYTRLAPIDAAPGVPRTAVPASGVAFRSSLQPGGDESVLAELDRVIWLDRLAEYKRRKVAAAPRAPLVAMAPATPFIPGAKNWLPLGPTVVLNGQTVGHQPVGGRVAGL